MTGRAIGLSLGYGYAGGISRTPDCVIETKPVKEGSEAIPFGAPCVLDATNTVVSAKTTTITAANFAGVATSVVQQLNAYPATTDSTGGEYTELQPCNILQRGIISVVVVHGTPTAGGAVYVRSALNGSFPNEVIGDFRADADGGNTVQLTNCSWNTGLKDSNNISELKVKSINN